MINGKKALENGKKAVAKQQKRQWQKGKRQCENGNGKRAPASQVCNCCPLAPWPHVTVHCTTPLCVAVVPVVTTPFFVPISRCG